MNVLNRLLEIFPISSFVIFCSCAKLFEYLEIKIKSPAYFYVFVSAEINLTHIGELKIHRTCTAIKYLVWQFYYLKGTTLIKSHKNMFSLIQKQVFHKRSSKSSFLKRFTCLRTR